MLTEVAVVDMALTATDGVCCALLVTTNSGFDVFNTEVLLTIEVDDKVDVTCVGSPAELVDTVTGGNLFA